MATRPRRPSYSRRAQYGLFATYVLTVAVTLVVAIMLVLARFDPTTFARLHTAGAEITTPISSGFAWVTRGLASVPQGVSDYFGVKQRNAALREQLAAERREVIAARALANENRRLKALLGVRGQGSVPVVTAYLVSSTASSTRRYAILDAGARRGVAVGQPVRGPDGLIGRVVEVGYNNARILLITDPESVVPVRRARDGLPAIAAGRGDGMVEIRAVDAANAVFRAGDIFLTSGTGGIFSPNIPVARATRSARDATTGRAFAHADTLDYATVERAFVSPAVMAERPR